MGGEFEIKLFPVGDVIVPQVMLLHSVVNPFVFGGGFFFEFAFFTGGKEE
ncbi:hypothetical protein Barb7_03054 [Bacteroidales bacterium Barb7]|nr:hypothetical protein Barb7_03054 [Bacteroidales bacterium Barb7]